MIRWEGVLLTLGWKTACISQDIPAAKRPRGLKLKHKAQTQFHSIRPQTAVSMVILYISHFSQYNIQYEILFYSINQFSFQHLFKINKESTLLRSGRYRMINSYNWNIKASTEGGIDLKDKAKVKSQHDAPFAQSKKRYCFLRNTQNQSNLILTWCTPWKQRKVYFQTRKTKNVTTWRYQKVRQHTFHQSRCCSKEFNSPLLQMHKSRWSA